MSPSIGMLSQRSFGTSTPPPDFFIALFLSKVVLLKRTSQHVMDESCEVGIGMSLTRRQPSLILPTTWNLMHCSKVVAGLRCPCLSCDQVERQGFWNDVILSFKMLHASIFLQFLTCKGVNATSQPNDNKSANMQV